MALQSLPAKPAQGSNWMAYGDVLYTNMAELASDIPAVKGDVSTLRTDVAALQARRHVFPIVSNTDGTWPTFASAWPGTTIPLPLTSEVHWYSAAPAAQATVPPQFEDIDAATRTIGGLHSLWSTPIAAAPAPTLPGTVGTLWVSEGFDAAETEAQFLARPADNLYGGTWTVTPTREGTHPFTVTASGLVVNGAGGSSDVNLHWDFPGAGDNRSAWFRASSVTGSLYAHARDQVGAAVIDGAVHTHMWTNASVYSRSTVTIPWVAGDWYRVDTSTAADVTTVRVTNLATNATMTNTHTGARWGEKTDLRVPTGSSATVTGWAVGAHVS